MDNLRALRKKRGLSQLRLAMELGLTQQSIHNYEAGKVEPDIRTLIELAHFFHVSVDYLIGNDPDTGTSAKPAKKKKAQREPEFSLRLTPAEYHFCTLYRSLSPKVRASLNLIMEEMVLPPPPSGTPDTTAF